MQGAAWPTRPLAFVVAWVGGLAWTTPVRAASDEVRVAVVPALVEGDVPADVQNDLNQRVKKALRSDSYELVEGEPPGGSCRDYKCIRRVAKATGARYVVAPSIGAIEHDYGIAIYVYDVTGGRGIERKSTCEICSHDEAIEALVAQAQDIHDPLVEFVQTPYGDREQESMTDDETPPPVVRRPTSSGAADKGEEKQTKALRVVGWTFGALGIAMLGGGIPLLAIHEDPYKKRCSGANIDFNGMCRYRYDTIVPGALLTSFGVAFLVTGISAGVVAFGRRNRKDKEKRTLEELEEDTISVRPIIGPTSAGVKVRF